MKKAIFLDRDGTIIKEVDYLHLGNLKEMRFFPGVAQAIKTLNRLGFLVVVITNQPVVARGYATEKEIDQIHAVLVKRLEKKGAKIDAIYFCPHHPEATLPNYRVRCRCRKPNTGMIIKATKKFSINLKKSFLVGDRLADVAAAKKAGVKMILVKTGCGQDTISKAQQESKHYGKPDFVAKNLKEAVKIIQKS